MNSKLLVLLTNPDVADLCSELGLQAKPEHIGPMRWQYFCDSCQRAMRFCRIVPPSERDSFMLDRWDYVSPKRLFHSISDMKPFAVSTVVVSGSLF